jgi:response regulator RpfG family c-di-GMP phosphodiesterase
LKRRVFINLGNFLLSLSDAIDLTSPLLTQHQQRVAFISWEMGKATSLSEEMIETMFIAALLHDVGALSLEERLSLHNFEEINIDQHCIRGEILLKTNPWLKHAAQIVRYHHRRNQEWSEPINIPLVMMSQIIFLADYLERLINRNQYILHQDQIIIQNISSLSGKLFHPHIVDLFKSIAYREEFWLDLVSPRLYSILLHSGPYRELQIDLPGIS